MNPYMNKYPLNFYYNMYTITINCTDLFQYLSIEDYAINQMNTFIIKQFDIDTLTITFSSGSKEFINRSVVYNLPKFLTESQPIRIITEKVKSPYTIDYTNTFTPSKGTS